MFCPLHLVIGKMETMDIADEITPFDDSHEFPILPIMANIKVPIRYVKTNSKVREKMRIDEPLDHITHAEHAKFEQLCMDFRDVQEKLNLDKNYVFPEDKFLRQV